MNNTCSPLMGSNSLSRILEQCTKVYPHEKKYKENKVIQRFGSYGQEIYLDPMTYSLDEAEYIQPLIMPLVNGALKPVQHVLLQDDSTSIL